MSELEYIPKGPYFIKSGERKGVSLEELMFKNYSWLIGMKGMLNARFKYGSKMNDMYEHLLWLLKRGEDRMSDTLCSYCKENKIFSFAYSYKEKKFYTCCNRWNPCVGQVLSKANRYPLKFSSIMFFPRSFRSLISNFFKSVFFPGCENPTAQQLFEFFSVPTVIRPLSKKDLWG